MTSLVLPRVTGVLKAVNLIDDRWFTEEARNRGTAVHLALGYHAEHDLDWKSVADSIKPYVEAGILFLEDSKAVIEGAEIEVLNERYGYVGHPDLVGIFFGDPAIPDYKSGSVDPDVAGVQTAAYELAIGAPEGAAAWRRFAVKLKNTGKYSLVHLDRRENGFIDRQRWLATLDLYNAFIAPRRRRTTEQEEPHAAIA